MAFHPPNKKVPTGWIITGGRLYLSRKEVRRVRLIGEDETLS